MFMRISMGILILVVGASYHSNGMNDWFAMRAVTEGVTLAQATNEVIANLCFCTGMILLLLGKEEKKK